MNGASDTRNGNGQGTRLFDRQDVVVMDVEGFEGFTAPFVSSQSKFGMHWEGEPSPVLSQLQMSPDTSFEQEPEVASPIDTTPTDEREGTPKPVIPSLSRAYSMPLPSQLGHLRNPHHREPETTPKNEEEIISPPLSQFHELSLELADSVQMVIQTLLQVSPPQLLDPAKEQFSACALSVPTSSMSAMFTSMKNLNYISANMATFCTESDLALDGPQTPREPLHTDFDVAEMLQSVGDALSGASAHSGVDLILFHGNVELKHLPVRGDESGISYALTHVIRQVIGTARRGDCIEIGLFVTAAPRTNEQPSLLGPNELGEPLRCVFDIAHKFVGESGEAAAAVDDAPRARSAPVFSTLLLRRLLRQIGGTLSSDLPPKTFPHGRTCELALTLEPGMPSLDTTPDTLTPDDPAYQLFETIKTSSAEPTLDELIQFTDTLRGKKVNLYASSKGSFAHHFTSYLTAWGMDVSHISLENGVEGGHVDVQSLTSTLTSPTPPSTSTYGVLSGTGPVTAKIDEVLEPPSFIFIDDDIAVLRERLQAARIVPAYPLNMNGGPLQKRPSLAANHRPQSSPHVARAMGGAIPSLATIRQQQSVVIVHFTSLANYKLVKDVLQSVLSSPSSSRTIIPEVMIIPKPAGPRRFLTALHTAMTKPTVDAFFSPIATSPMTPSLLATGFFNQHSSTSSSSPPATSNSGTRDRPSGSRSSSDRSAARSPKEPVLDGHHPPPSPLGMTDSTEYFSDHSTNLITRLGISAASGMVIQSPDGQPAGIFFHPKGKTSRSFSNGVTMERGINGKRLISTPRPGAIIRQSMSSSAQHSPVEGGDSDMPGSHSFSSLHLLTSDLESTPRATARRTGSGRSETGSPMSPLSEHVGGRISPSTSMSSPPPRRASRRMTIEAARVPQTPGAPVVPAKKGKKGKAKANDGTIVPPISVLVVDDNPINQTILGTFMRKNAIKYDVANNGREAVDKWKTGGFHLILMDIQMPIMNGIDATKEIRRLEKASDSGFLLGRTPSSDRSSPFGDQSGTLSERPSTSSSVIIVALTASSLQADRVAALAAGCNDFLTKPVSLKWLNSKIIEWGSIKALQMYLRLPLTVDLTHEVPASVLATQSAQTKRVAMALHVPPGRATPGPSSRMQSPAAPRQQLPVEAAPQESLSISDTIAMMPPTLTFTDPTPPPPAAPEVFSPASEVPTDEELAAAQQILADAPVFGHPMVDDPRVPSPDQTLTPVYEQPQTSSDGSFSSVSTMSFTDESSSDVTTDDDSSSKDMDHDLPTSEGRTTPIQEIPGAVSAFDSSESEAGDDVSDPPSPTAEEK